MRSMRPPMSKPSPVLTGRTSASQAWFNSYSLLRSLVASGPFQRSLGLRELNVNPCSIQPLALMPRRDRKQGCGRVQGRRAASAPSAAGKAGAAASAATSLGESAAARFIPSSPVPSAATAILTPSAAAKSHMRIANRTCQMFIGFRSQLIVRDAMCAARAGGHFRATTPRM